MAQIIMMKIIGIVGQAGSGKTEAGEYIEKKYGIKLYNTSDILVEEAKKRNLPFDKNSLSKLADTMREESNAAFASQMTLEKVRKDGLNVAVLAGLRSPEEVDFLRNEVEEFLLIWVDADPSVRYERRREKELNEDDFFARDEDDLKKKHLGKVLLMADEKIVNDGIAAEMEGKVTKVLIEHGFI